MSLALSKTDTAPEASLAPLQKLVAGDMTRVNQMIISQIQSDVPLISELATYIIAAGGKRLRPSLTLACAQLCGYEGERHIALATSVEFIHTATLLHDDVVDESALRRGNATANNVWGNKASVLVGDFLLSRAFQLMVKDADRRALEILSDASAIIAEGEVLQLTAGNDPATSETHYMRVITAKTATLFAAACALGAVVSGQKEREPLLYDFGLNLGIAFQLVDDALDYASDAKTLGKTIGDDFREHKITYPLIHAYQQGSDKEKSFWASVLDKIEPEESDLRQALELLSMHHSIQATRQKAEDYCHLARKALENFAEGPMKSALLSAIDFSVQRVY